MANWKKTKEQWGSDSWNQEEWKKQTRYLFEEIQELWYGFSDNHEKFEETGNKSAARRARQILGELKTKISLYKGSSVEATKK